MTVLFEMNSALVESLLIERFVTKQVVFARLGAKKLRPSTLGMRIAMHKMGWLG